MKKRIGKIEKVSFGIGGYQDAMLGLHLQFKGKGWGVNDYKAFWDYERIKHSNYTKWSEVDRDIQAIKVLRFVSKTLADARVDRADQLRNRPVEVIFDGKTLVSWRILTEEI